MAAGPVQGSASRLLACGVRRAPVAYCRGLSARGTGEILYVRGLINAMLGVEAIRTAQEKFGKKPLTGEQVRWGLENLNLPAERLSNLDSRTSCNRSRCHAPTTRGRIQTWDGKKWNIVSGWITADDSIIAPMVKEAAAKYAAEKKITAGCVMTN